MRTPDWIQHNQKKAARLYERIQEALREVGVLLMAFAPLDAALTEDALRAARVLALFLTGGMILFATALALEWSQENESG